MRQARRKLRKPEQRLIATAPLKMLILVCALTVPGCASWGFSDTLLSAKGFSFKEPSTIRSQNSASSDRESPATSNAADYSAVKHAAGAANLQNPGDNTAISDVPVYAGGHAFTQRRARLGKPIPLPDNRETASVVRNDHPINGHAISLTTSRPSTVGSETNDTLPESQRSSQQHVPAKSTGNVAVQSSEFDFGSAGWQGIPDPDTTDRSAKNTGARNQEDAFTNTADTPGETDAATTKEPTVLDRLRGYIPRRDEPISERNRKSNRRWTDPFGLLREREPDTVDATVGATSPLSGPAESVISATEITDTTEAAQGSEALLTSLIAQVEQDLAQWPMLPNNAPRNKLEWRRRQTDLRMLYLIAGRSAESIRVIESLPEKEQEFWQSMMLAMESYRRNDDSGTRAEQLTETLEYVRAASRQLQPLSTMKIRRLNFCNRIDGFGIFSVFPTSDFHAGQPLLLYAEIENYKSEVTSDGQYRSVFAAKIEFLREGETEPIASRNIQLPEIEDLCAAERTDYFQSYELTVPSLSPGRYILRLSVKDQLSSQTATTELRFDIRPIGSQP